MAPGRKRGGKGLKTTNELSVGDLVLAKVKGFPAWPAKIGNPEDWERAPDPKKYFVQFYGTAEIAFVAPADIQEFTNEAKNKVIARCKGKTVKYFAQAVDEICEEYDKSQQKDSNSLEDETNENALARENPSLGQVTNDGMEVDLKDGNNTNGLHQEIVDHGSMLERCTQKQEVNSSENVTLCLSVEKDANLSLDPNVNLSNTLKIDGPSVLSFSNTNNHLFFEESASEMKVEGSVVTLTEQPRKVEGDLATFKPMDQKDSINGVKPESKKKSEVRSIIGSGVTVLPAHDKGARILKPSISGTQGGNGVRYKIGSDNGNSSGKKKLLKDKHHYVSIGDHVKTNSEQLPRKKKMIQQGREMQTSQNHELSSPSKRPKCLDMAADYATKLSVQTNRKMECSKGLNVHDEEVKRSGIKGKMENRLISGVQVASSADSSFTRDEDALPPTKRRRREDGLDRPGGLGGLGGPGSENRIKKVSVAIKNELSGSDSKRSLGTVPAKRRAVRIVDDNDDEAPKTPIHGGSVKKVMTASKMLDASKRIGGPGESSASFETLKKKTSILKDTSSMERPVSYLSPSSQQDMEKRTPIHGGSVKKVMTGPNALKKTGVLGESSASCDTVKKKTMFKDSSVKELTPFMERPVSYLSPSSQQDMGKKTPIHVGSAKTVLAAPKVLDTLKKESSASFETLKKKTPSIERSVAYTSPSSQHDVEKKVRKTRDTPERLVLEEVNLKEGETVLSSPLKSSPSMLEIQKANEESTKLPNNADRKKALTVQDKGVSVVDNSNSSLVKPASGKNNVSLVISEEVLTVVPSPLKSPAPVALSNAIIVETQKASEDLTKLPNNTDEKKAIAGQDKGVSVLESSNLSLSKPASGKYKLNLSERLITEEVTLKKGPSPLNSPAAPVASTKVMFETQKVNEDSTKLHNNTDRKKDNLNSSLSKSASGRNKPSLSIERSKTSIKSNSQTVDSVRTLGARSLSSERLEVGREDIMSSSDLSMKHLIAAAQAKRKEAHMQNTQINSLSMMGLNVEATRGSHSPISPAQLLGSYNNMLQSRSSLASPSSEREESEEKRNSSGNGAAVGPLSGGSTEAAVARDAFEGMIETLSRTKESIGRATRLAIDCAKHGIANEVIELLIQKLESEPTSHRKVDLFFLVDSITQCSHSHKGIAGASYIPTVQAALPRLIGAAAPPGAHARENRRQCLKVLRLWLERKIFADSLLRPHMDEVGVAVDEISSGVSFRRITRAERAIDDPIREMEGMLVDEYGSNATFHLPGIFPPHAFADDDDEEEEEDFPSTTGGGNEMAETSPLSAADNNTPGTTTSKDVENHVIMTPNERRHCILEDVDGELEMEDVSGHLIKDEIPPPVTVTATTTDNDVVILSESVSAEVNQQQQLLREGSPPLPPDSPPQTPVLPSSPPPPPPPPSPSQLQQPPPWIPPTVSQQNEIGMPPVNAPPHPQKSPCFLPPPLEYGTPNAQAQAQASQPNQQFPPPVNAPPPPPYTQVQQRPPLHPQNPPNHFSYPNIPSPYPPPYSLPNHPEPPRQQWRPRPVEFNNDHHNQTSWIGPGRSCSGPPFVQEGYLRPPQERPPSNAFGYQISTPSCPPAGTSVPGHSLSGPSLSWRPV